MPRTPRPVPERSAAYTLRRHPGGPPDASWPGAVAPRLRGSCRRLAQSRQSHCAPTTQPRTPAPAPGQHDDYRLARWGRPSDTARSASQPTLDPANCLRTGYARPHRHDARPTTQPTAAITLWQGRACNPPPAASTGLRRSLSRTEPPHARRRAPRGSAHPATPQRVGTAAPRRASPRRNASHPRE